MASCYIEVYIKLPSGKAISSQHHPSDRVTDVANFVADKEGVPHSYVRLKYQGKLLDKTKTLGYLGVCEETILKGEILTTKDLTIYIKSPDGTCEPMLVQNTNTVSQLNTRIHDKTGINIAEQCIKKESTGVTIMGPASLLADVGVTNECILEVTIKKPVTSTPNDTTKDVEEEVDEETKQEIMNTFDSQGKRVEVVFCFDTTGSMYSCLNTVRRELSTTCNRLLRDIPEIRIGIMAHGDYCDYDTYIVRYVDLTSNVDDVVSFVNDVPSTGGGDAPEVRLKLRETCERLLRDIPNIRIGIMGNGDYCDYNKYVVKYTDLTSDVDTVINFVTDVPSTGGGGNGGECYEWALRKAQHLDWSEDSAKAFVMIGDEPPHIPSYTNQDVFWKEEADVLAGMGVKIYAVQALDRDESTPFYEDLAERTNGYYLRLKNFRIITDMFLAVCYNEAGQLDEFVEEENENEESMVKEAKEMIEKSELKPKTENEREEQSTKTPKRHNVRHPWWERSLDKGKRPEYLYDPETDEWRPNQSYQHLNTASSSSPASMPSLSYRTGTTTQTKRKSKLRRLFCFS